MAQAELDTEDLVSQGAEERRAHEQHVSMVLHTLLNLARDQETRRQSVEQRWLSNLRQFHGVYDAATKASIKDNRSSLFVKLTRQKCNAWIARISDLLFPTDEENWSVDPTPIPELTEEAASMAAERDRMIAEANSRLSNGDQEGAEIARQAADRAGQAAEQAHSKWLEAVARAEKMERIIRDHFIESGHVSECRKAIADGVKLGTGVIAGPFVRERKRTRWRRPQQDGVEETQPYYLHISAWDFYPDMDAADEDSAEFFFVRHLCNRRQLRKLAEQVDMIPEAVEFLLEQEPTEAVPNYLQEMRGIRSYDMSLQPRLHVWSYYGPLKGKELRALFLEQGDIEAVLDMENWAEDDDDIDCVVWFSQGRLLKVGLHPLDSGRPLFSVWSFEKDDSSIFGIGCPETMEFSQDAVNAAWRMMLDNAAIAAGPQIMVDTTVLEPANGNWRLEPFNVWKTKMPLLPGTKPFDMFLPQVHTDMLDRIVERARQFTDDETNMPLIAQGEQASHITQTAHGMSILMNSANVVFRRTIRDWDDKITIPTVEKAYEWEMQFGRDESAKGDMQVHARGSSVLLARELQAQNLLMVATQWTQNPVLAEWVKPGPALREACKAMMIPVDTMIRTDEEYEQIQAQKAEMPQPPSPEEVKVRIAQMEQETRIKIAQINQETTMMQVAEQRNMTLDQARARLEIERGRREGQRRKIESDERKFAAEKALGK